MRPEKLLDELNRLSSQVDDPHQHYVSFVMGEKNQYELYEFVKEGEPSVSLRVVNNA